MFGFFADFVSGDVLIIFIFWCFLSKSKFPVGFIGGFAVSFRFSQELVVEFLGREGRSPSVGKNYSTQENFKNTTKP